MQGRIRGDPVFGVTPEPPRTARPRSRPALYFSGPASSGPASSGPAPRGPGIRSGHPIPGSVCPERLILWRRIFLWLRRARVIHAASLNLSYFHVKSFDLKVLSLSVNMLCRSRVVHGQGRRSSTETHAARPAQPAAPDTTPWVLGGGGGHPVPVRFGVCGIAPGSLASPDRQAWVEAGDLCRDTGRSRSCGQRRHGRRGCYPARAGGLWLCRTFDLSRFQAVVVPSGCRTRVQPIRWIMT